ncbi:MAG: ATP-binding protein [Proteobacteria bacterium]|nr:ATP-binding protein [Pseudomonadota bacterium]
MERKFESEAQPDEITKPANINSIPALTEFVSVRVREAGFSDEKNKAIGLAVEEALQNIIRFACPDGKGDIRITFNIHDSGTLLIEIVDSGIPFNMLLAGTFSELEDFYESGKIPSNKMMKKAIKNIEYRRGTDRNTILFTIPPNSAGTR